MNRKQLKIALIHHSHTDIGYTQRQDKIGTYHSDFIRQAVHILNDIHSKNMEEYKGFVWQCENFWQVEKFYENAAGEEKDAFEEYVKRGEIGISGNYLNMTELVSMNVLYSRLEKAKKYGEEKGISVTCGMSADINGLPWGYGDALYDNGITCFYSCLHPHHGMFPLYKKMMPFYWETPKGNKVLVWNGEHYHFGNELHFAPNGGTTYMIQDEISRKIRWGLTCRDNKEAALAEEMEHLRLRLKRYLDNLEEEGYPYDVVPFMVSGAITDNAPPSMEIARRVGELNREYEGSIIFEMTTLDRFFDEIIKQGVEIPTYKGDWNDWWADGVGSTPAPVKVYKEAERKLNLCEKLDKYGILGDKELVEQASQNMMLYGEHTWGYSSSVAEPWETLVGSLELKKEAYAIHADTCISKNLDRILAKKGEVTIQTFRPLKFKIINPHSRGVKTKALLYVEFWEYLEGTVFDMETGFDVVDLISGQTLPSQMTRIARAYEIEVMTELGPLEEKEVYLRKKDKKRGTVKNNEYIGAEGVRDVVLTGQYEENTSRVETQDFVILMNQKDGIRKIIDKRTNTDIIRPDRMYAPFTGIYEVTDMEGNPCEARRKMGRNRKAEGTRRYGSILKNISMAENGPVFLSLKLDYALEGTKMYTVLLKIYKQMPRIDACVRIHKESVWEPENLYVSLPFTAGEEQTAYIDKTGCIIRPGIDQLPGTNQEFYLLHNGIVLKGNRGNVGIAIKDAPLVVFGDLESKPIRLCTGNDWDLNRALPYSWIMNNYWETNFKVDLGGFYEFAYSLFITGQEGERETMEQCREINEGILGFYI